MKFLRTIMEHRDLVKRIEKLEAKIKELETRYPEDTTITYPPVRITYPPVRYEWTTTPCNPQQIWTYDSNDSIIDGKLTFGGGLSNL